MLYLVSRELFYFLTAALLCFSSLEAVWPGVVFSRFNFIWLLIFWLIFGIVILLKQPKNL